jgi:hypothetical protein
MTFTRTVTLAATLALAALLAACGDDTTPASDGGTTPPVEDTAPPKTTPDAAPTTDAPQPSAPDEEAIEEYGPSASFIALDGNRTLPILEPLADGIYYSATYSTDGDEVVVTLSQYFLCDSTTNVPEHPTIVCASGFGTLDEPTIEVAVDAGASVTIAIGDLDNSTYAQVSAAEFARLVDGKVPSPNAPTGFEFTPAPMFVEVSDGVVINASQLYMS